MPNKLKRDVFEDFFDNCVENVRAEEEVERWTTKQPTRCLRTGDEVRSSWYEQKVWESSVRRRFFDEETYKASRELRELMMKCGESKESDISWIVLSFPYRISIYPPE